MNGDNRPAVVLNGNDLSIEDIVAVGVGDKSVVLDAVALDRCRASRAFLEQEVASERIIYGVNTSFGPMCNKIIHDDELEKLQVNLIRSHAAGLGAALPFYIARAVLVVRLNCLLKGYSGVRDKLLEFFKEMINRGICPYIPECGSVGASGDLVHLAHVALALIGEGKVFYRKQLRDTADVFRETGMKPLRLSFKEGIAVLNGTSAMTALAAFVIYTSKKLLRLAYVNAAFAVEIFGGIDDAFDVDLHKVKAHPGQINSAAIIRKLYAGSKNIVLRENMHDRIRNQKSDGPVYETSINVQDVYSIRCTPQILAPVCEAVEHAEKSVLIEANSSNDNPIIIPDGKKIIHGGNFHGQSIGFAMDMLTIALSELCTLSERRINKLLDKNLNEGLPEHLIIGTPGLAMGFMGAQYLGTSTTAENRQLANPVSTLSISCNASNQDVVSMGTVAARKAFRAASNSKHVLTLETLADLQAFTFKDISRLGKGTKKIHEILSKHFVPYDNSRAFHDELKKFRKLLFSSGLFDDLSVYYSA
ncbi:MAG: histidine ammonia-lyase [Chitinivibrionales bacterium]|nr:histidine ammonia-lyase [Chitinivibrionales bacterium]